MNQFRIIRYSTVVLTSDRVNLYNNAQTRSIKNTERDAVKIQITKILLDKSFVNARVEKARVRVAVHQRVYLQLSLVECVWRRMNHVTVDHFARSRIKAYLSTGKKRQHIIPGALL
jgi:hypothetical protein